MVWNGRIPRLKGGACQSMPADKVEELFFASAGQPHRRPAKAVQGKWNEAKAICAGCPIRPICRDTTLGIEYGVVGGLDQHERYVRRQAFSKAVMALPPDKLLNAARRVWELRTGPAALDATGACRKTGLNKKAASALYELYKQHLKELPRPAVRAPEPASTPSLLRPVQFPAGDPDKADAWVKDKGLATPAYYVSQTPDGRYIQMKIKPMALRPSIKWFPVEDVSFRRTIEPVIKEWTRRPDGASQTQAEDRDAA